MITQTTADPHDIPAFLRVTKADAERRRKWNAEHPITYSGQTTEDLRDVAEARKKLAEEQEAEKARVAASYRAKVKLKADGEKAGSFMEPVPGSHFDSSTNRWVHPNVMSPAKYKRLMGEMPTEAHRVALRKTYGAGQCASVGSDITHDEPAVGKREASRTTKARSRTDNRQAAESAVVAPGSGKEGPDKTGAPAAPMKEPKSTRARRLKRC